MATASPMPHPFPLIAFPERGFDLPRLAGRGAAVLTRFAPSPTGPLHLGHAFAALFAHDTARAHGGRFLLRIEDIDATRCRREHEAALLADLAWLGLSWDGPVRRQSAHFDDYAGALARLERMEIIYPCFCTRREIAAEIARSQSAPHGPEGPVYPGTCRRLAAAERAERRAAGTPFALRLDMERALALAALKGDEPLAFAELGMGPAGEHGWIGADPRPLGDVVLARKEVPASYHLAVVVDDALQGVSLVTRGQDLFHATALHRLLQCLLGLPVPRYCHHPLLRDAQGRRLAKRTPGLSLRDLRAQGVSPSDIRRRLGLPGRQQAGM